MRALDNLAMALLLLSAIANAAAHYMSQFNEEARLIGAPFACAALAALGMLAILVLLTFAPDWPARGPGLLALAVALLGAAAWFHRARLPSLPRASRRATD